MFNRVKREKSGQGLVEFALILPLLLLIILGIFEFGRVLFIYSGLFNAAREGARYGVTSPRNYGGIRTRATEFIAMAPAEDVTIQVWYDSGPGTTPTTDPNTVAAGVSRVLVHVEYAIAPIPPWSRPFTPPLQLQTTAARTVQNVGLVVDPPPTVQPPGGGNPTDPPPPTEEPTGAPPPSGASISINPMCANQNQQFNLIVTGWNFGTVTRINIYVGTDQIVNNHSISGGTFTYTKNNYTIPTAGQYVVRVENRANGVTLATATLTVPCPTPTPTPTKTPTPTPSPTPTASPIPTNDIVIDRPVVMGQTSIAGSAQPGETVTLRIIQTGLQRTAIVGPDGRFLFDGLPALEGGMTLIVQGYGKQDSVVVQGGTATPTPTPTPLPTGGYITLNPSCGPAGNQTITVRGFNWPRGNYLVIKFDSTVLVSTGQKLNVSSFAYTINVSNVTPYVPHQVTAEAWTQKNQGGTRVYSHIAPFDCPCPVPDLVVNDLRLLSTPPLGTYNRVDFQVSVANQGGADIPSLFWVDLYDNDYPDPGTDISLDYIAINGLPAGASITFTMWVDQGFPVTGTHTLTALADTWNQIREFNENNNLSDPLVITVTQTNPAPTPTPTPAVTPGPLGTIQGTTYMDGVPQNLVNIYIYDPEGRLRWSGFSRAYTAPSGAIINGYYEAELPPGNYVIIGQVRMANAIYRGQTVVNGLQSGEIRQEVDLNLTNLTN